MGDRIRLLTAALLLATIRLSLFLVSFSRLRTALLRLGAAGEQWTPGTPAPDRVAWAVRVADRNLPGGFTCLIRSLTTEVLLRLYGYTPVHRIGVNRTADGTFEAHSWIEYEGEILIGELENLSKYDPLPPLDGSGGS